MVCQTYAQRAGLAAGLEFIARLPGTAADLPACRQVKDIKVQVNKQKPNPDSYRDTSSPDEAQQR
ncbi:hypothetical protein [Ferruginibacter profundus]